MSEQRCGTCREPITMTLLKGFAEKHQLYLDKEETRRAALLEARQAVSKLFDQGQSQQPDYYCALLDVGNTIDRLAQEGASSIDLSPTIKDDGGYGEHF